MTVRIFRHYISRSTLILAAVEGLLMALSLYGGVFLRFWRSPPSAMLDLEPLLPKALVFGGVMLTLFAATGLYQRALRETVRGIANRIIVSFLLGAVIMTLVFYLWPGMYIGRGAFILSVLIAFAGVSGIRVLDHLLSTYERFKRRVLVIGAGSNAALIEKRLRRRSDTRDIVLVGYVPLPGQAKMVGQDKILEVETDLADLACNHKVDELVLTTNDRSTGLPVEQIIECKMSGVEVIDRITFYERQTGKIYLDLLQPADIIFLDGFHQAALRSYSKRSFDIATSLVLLTLALPVMGLAALAILLEAGGRGPVLYRQERVGRDGETFDVIKFRSMRVDAEADGEARWATKGDSRITRVGRFIRKTRIDELPQLFNVLKGDMSFVGPRPERPQFVEELARQIPYYTMRHRVNPGITGWAQVSYPYGATVQDAKEKLQYDLYYIKNFSLFLDLAILFQTVQVVLWGQGAH